MSALFPFITLKSLKNGYSYHGKIKKFLNEDYYENLIKIDDSKIEEIAEYMNGINLKSKLFESLTWSLYLNPIPDLEIYFLCAREDVKNEFSVVFGRESKKIPTEDVYAFTYMYILTLSKIGENLDQFIKPISPKKFASIKPLIKTKFKPTVETFYKNIALLKVPFIEKKLKKHPQFIIKGNILLYKVYNDFFIKFNLGDELDISVSIDAVKKHGAKFVITFIGLIINSLKRELIK